MKRLVLTLLAVLALAAAGCGGSNEKDAYVDRVNEVNAEFTKTFTEAAAQATSATTPQLLGSELDRRGGILDDLADELQSIDPPADARAGHRRVVAGIRAFADDFRAAADEARDGHVQRALERLADSDGRKEYEAGIKQIADDAGIRREG